MNIKKAVVKQFNEQPVEFLTDKNNELWITADALGKALDYKDPRTQVIRLFNRHRDLLQEFSTVVKLTTVTGPKETRVFNETGCNIIAMKANTKKAKEFIIWAARIITEYRHGRLQKKPSAALLKELSAHASPCAMKLFIRDTFNIPVTPKEILQYYFLGMATLEDIGEACGYDNRAHFFSAVNSGKIKAIHKEKIAAMIGLKVSDIWPE